MFGEAFLQGFKILTNGKNTAAEQEFVSIIGGETFVHIPRAGVIFAGVLVGLHFGGTNGFDVPGVKQFVATHAQHIFVGASAVELVTRTDGNDGVFFMFHAVIKFNGQYLK